MRPKWCDRALVRSPYFILCLTEKDFHRELRRMEISRSDWPDYVSGPAAGATVHTFDKGAPYPKIMCFVNLSEWAKRYTGIEIAGLLVHEAVHIWQKVRVDLGEDSPSSEFEAYSIQSIAQELMWSYAEQTKRRAKVA